MLQHLEKLQAHVFPALIGLANFRDEYLKFLCSGETGRADTVLCGLKSSSDLDQPRTSLTSDAGCGTPRRL